MTLVLQTSPPRHLASLQMKPLEPRRPNAGAFLLMQPMPEVEGALAKDFDYPTIKYPSVRHLLTEPIGQMVGTLVTPFRYPAMETNDFNFPRNSLELIKELKQRRSALRVVILLAGNEITLGDLHAIFHSDADDLIVPSMTEDKIRFTIEHSLKRSIEMHATVQNREDLNLRISSLTSREADVVQQLSLGLPLKEISAVLQISVQTASKHRSRIFHKLQVSNEVELHRVYGDLIKANRAKAIANARYVGEQDA